MIHATATVPVNPQGEVPLTRAQAWAGLVLKARDARQFLPPGLCTRCDVVEESTTHIVREATIAGADLREIISFEQGSKALFEDEAGALQLRFYCYTGLRGKEPNGPEEQAEQAWMNGEQGYKTALLSTLQRTRALVASGVL